MKQRKKSFGMRISAFVLSFAMVCTLLAGVNVVAFAAEDTLSVICFYNDADKGGDGEHLFTKDEGEMTWLSGQPTWNNYGEAWKAPVSSSLAIYRCYNPNSGEHHYAAAGEAEWLVSQGWTQEKLAFYSDDNMGVPIYRLWNGLDGVGSHYYTTNEGEAAWLVSIGWKAEGVNFYGVKEEEPGEIAGVVIDNMSPKVGDTITATVVDGNGEEVFGLYKYQWYRTQGTEITTSKIAGETDDEYTVQSLDQGYAIFCEVTTLDGEVFQSKATAKINDQEIKKLSIKGMSGKSDDALKEGDTPLVLDVLTAVTDPEVDSSLLEYQWYRGSSAIVGATKASYTVTPDDLGEKLTVEIKAVDKDSVKIAEGADTAKTKNVVGVNIQMLDVTLNKSEAEANDTLKVTVKYGDTKIPAGRNQYTVTWFKDDPTLITNYLAVGDEYTVPATLAGHTVVAVVKGNDFQTTYINGTTMVTCDVEEAELSTLTIKSDNGDSLNWNDEGMFTTGDDQNGETYHVGQTFLADVGLDETATFEWTVNGTVVSTSPMLTLTADMVDIIDEEPTTNNKIVCEATGIGSYTGTKKITLANATVESTALLEGFYVYDVSDPSMTPILLNNDGTMDEGTVLFEGHTYTVVALPMSATSLLNTTWFYTTGNDNTYQSMTGNVFTVPTGINYANPIMVSSYYKGNLNDKIVPGDTGSALYGSLGTAMISPTDFGQRGVYATNWGSRINCTTGSLIQVEIDDEHPEVAGNLYFVPGVGGINGNIVAGSDNLTAFTFGAQRDLKSLTITIDNSESMNPYESGYTTYETPEVRAYAHATVAPGIACDYQWYRWDGETEAMFADPINGADDATYQIQLADLGKYLICEVKTDEANYQTATLYDVTDGATAPSSIELVSFKIFDTATAEAVLAAGTPAAYNKAQAVTKLTADQEYQVVTLDSAGKLNVGIATVIFDGSDAEKVTIFKNAVVFKYTPEEGDGIVTVTVTPNQLQTAGETQTFTFSTEVGGDTDVVKYNMTGTATNVYYKNAAGQYVVLPATEFVENTTALYADTTGTALKVKVNGIKSYDKVQWYAAEAGTTTYAAVTHDSGKTTTLSLGDAGVTVAEGASFYAVFTDSKGNTYTSSVITLK